MAIIVDFARQSVETIKPAAISTDPDFARAGFSDRGDNVAAKF